MRTRERVIISGEINILPAKVYGKLEGESDVLLGIAEKAKDLTEIAIEYSDVYGYKGEILFSLAEVSYEELKEIRIQAYDNLFAALNGPINKIINTLQK